IELITIVHRDVQRVIEPCDRRHLTQTGSVTYAIRLFLPEFVFVKLPDSAVLFEQLARILSFDLRAAIRGLTRIRWSANVDVERSLAIKRDALVAVLLTPLES